MLKGLALTPPVLGRISIGKVVEKNGKRLPEKDDQFTITSQVQGKDGWLLHPLNEELRQGKEDKLRSIPVRLLFNEPELNFRADYTLFDRQSGRPLCVGNGETCKRVTPEGMQSLPCPSPGACSLAKGGACKPYGRLNVVIGDDDPLGSFVFRTTGFNSIRTLAARLHYFQAISGNRLACLPLELRLRGKSTRQSHGTPIFYVDLTVRGGMDMAEALLVANELDAQRQAAGFDQAALMKRRGVALAMAPSRTARKMLVQSPRSSTPPRKAHLQPPTLPNALRKPAWPRSWTHKHSAIPHRPITLKEPNMRLHKLKASESTGTYLVESPVSEADILLMARQLANLRLRKDRALTSPKEAFSHLQALLADYEHEVFALLHLDSRHRVIAFQELFRGTLDGASVYPREVVKAALERNAAAMILVHNHPSGDPEPSQADRNLTHKLKEALNLVGVRTLDHIVVGHESCISLAEQGYL